MKAPLIAVISVGIAAAAPAVAISAMEPSSAQSPGTARGAVTDTHQPIGAVPNTETANADEQKKHQRLVKRYVRLRNRLNRLIAKREGRRQPKLVRGLSAKKAQWPDRKLLKATRQLRKRIRRRAEPHPRHRLGARRAGPDRRLRVTRQSPRDRRRRSVPRQVPVHLRDLGFRGRQGRSRRRSRARARPSRRDSAAAHGRLSLAGLRLGASSRSKHEKRAAPMGAARSRSWVRSRAWTSSASEPSFPCWRRAPI